MMPPLRWGEGVRNPKSQNQKKLCLWMVSKDLCILVEIKHYSPMQLLLKVIDDEMSCNSVFKLADEWKSCLNALLSIEVGKSIHVFGLLSLRLD